MLLRVIFCLLLTGTFSLQAIPAQGEALEKEMWEAMKNKNWNLVELRLSSDFQSVHQDGARGRKEEIALIKDLKLNSPTLSEFHVTEGEGLYIITYKVQTGETIDGKKLSDTPTPRLSVWKKSEAGIWQWVAHANLNPIPVAEDVKTEKEN